MIEENRVLGILDEQTEEILRLVNLLRITKIPFETDCSRRIRIFYPNKKVKRCEISRNIFSSEDVLDMFWDLESFGDLDVETNLKHFEVYLKLKEDNNRKVKKKKFFLKRKIGK